MCELMCKITHMEGHELATNLNIDEKLLLEALRLSGKRTKRETVNEALAEYVARHKRKQILQLAGQIDFDPDYDYKKQRSRNENSR